MTPVEDAVEEGHTGVIEYFAKECKLNIKDLNDVGSNILCMYNTIILGDVACYNIGWGYYSNNHYLFRRCGLL